MKYLVTGGAGFIGSTLVSELLKRNNTVVNVDKLTYAGNIETVKKHQDNPDYEFEHVDICDAHAIRKVFEKHKPDVVFHLAAESHVDRSIDGPLAFVQTNIVGTFNLLEEANRYWKSLENTTEADQFRFIHVSTDEVYGDLEDAESLFTEETSYSPNSPYAATKASSDHLARAWCRTYGLPVIVTNCSNNYGPYQFPEKLIPLVIDNCLAGISLPVYGNGEQIRDWLYVQDHAEALIRVAEKGAISRTYNIGGNNEVKNIDVVKTICSILDQLVSEKPNQLSSFEELITFVKDRPGHDTRYAIDSSRIQAELGWAPKETFETGLEKTVEWYLANQDWANSINSDSHTDWLKKQYKQSAVVAG